MLLLTIGEIKEKVFALSFLTTFVSIFAGFFVFIEAGNAFGVIQIKDKNLVYYLGLIILSLALALIHNTLLLRQEKKVFLLEKTTEVKKNLKRLNISSKRIMNEGNYYKLIYLSWILENEYDKSRMKDIDGVDSKMYSITAQKPLNYIISIINGIINRLSEHDTFFTISNIDFWSHITEDKGFLEANISAVKENGVTIDRIVVIDRNTLLLNNSDEKKDSLRNIIEALNSFYTTHKEAFTDKLIWQFYVSDQYEIDNIRPVPYAIIINSQANKKDCMFMHPITTQDGDALQMNLRFGKKMSEINIVSYYIKFNNLKSRTNHLYSIDQIFSKLFDNNGEWNIR